MAKSIEELSFELTTSALAEQERALSGMRLCAGTVLGAASVSGSFLGARAVREALGVWAIIATISFALCVVCGIWVLLPRELALAFGGDELLADGDLRGAGDVVQAYRAAGRWIEPRLQMNRRTLSHLADALTAGCVLLAIEVITWTISLAG